MTNGYNRGMTLVELLLVVSVIGILLAALGFEFAGWQTNYNAERVTRQIYSDLLNARVRAMQRNRVHFFKFLGSSPYTRYQIVEDTNENFVNDDAAVPGSLQQLRYPVWWANADGTNRCSNIMIDKHGQIYITAADCTEQKAVGYVKASTAKGTSPDYNCIKVEQTRVSLGQMPYDPDSAFSAGSTCNVK